MPLCPCGGTTVTSPAQSARGPLTLPPAASACISLSAANCPCKASISSFFRFSASSVAAFFCAWHENYFSIRIAFSDSLRNWETNYSP